VLPTATDREIHEAWRKRRKQNHPDHAAQDPAEFARRSRFSAEINRARDIIENHRSGGARRPHA
jgi:curved DNA-binding protein CbpA